MSDNELLRAISNMMDEKLASELQPIKSDLHIVKEELRNVKEDLRNVKEDLQNVRERVGALEEKVQQISLCQENVIIPRLNTIESCYTDTFRRYRENADRMEQAFEDIATLKSVVAEHSEQLRNLA